MNIKYVDTDTVMCEDDHPRVYYRLQDGEAVCGYCNIKFIHKDKIESESIKKIIQDEH